VREAQVVAAAFELRHQRACEPDVLLGGRARAHERTNSLPLNERPRFPRTVAEPPRHLDRVVEIDRGAGEIGSGDARGAQVGQQLRQRGVVHRQETTRTFEERDRCRDVAQSHRLPARAAEQTGRRAQQVPGRHG